MAQTFDAYHKWLGIPPEEQPPHHYRLLGIKTFETDPDVIETAADRQMVHVRTFQNGPRADECQRLLNQIAGAKAVLLQEEKKAAYDAQLQADSAETKQQDEVAQSLLVAAPLEVKPAPAKTAAPRPAPQVGPAPRVGPLPAAAVVASPRAGRKPTSLLLPLLLVGGALALGLIAVLALAVALWPRGDGQPVAGGNSSSTANRGNSDPSDGSPDNGASNNGTNNNGGPSPPPDVILPPDHGGPNTGEVTGNNTDPPADARPGGRISIQLPASTRVVKASVSPPDDGGDTSVPAAAQKTPIPDKAQRDKKRAEIEAIFSFKDARTAEEKTALAAQLLKVGRETNQDLVAQFELFNAAREIAAEVGQIRVAFAAIDELSRQFEFDADAVRMATLKQTTRLTAVLPEARGDLIQAGDDAVKQLIEQDEYDQALEMIDLFMALVRRWNDRQTLAALIEGRKTTQQLQEQYSKAAAAFETLKTNPDDADANLAAGLFVTFVKEDLGRGLPMLAKGSNEQLALAAKAEIVGARTSEQEQKLGEAWWQLAEAERVKDLKEHYQARSFAWYQRAKDGLSGLAKVRAEQRLRDLADAGIKPAELVRDLGIFSRPPDERVSVSIPGVDSPDVSKGLLAHWTFDEGQGTQARDVAGGHHGTIKGATWTKGVRGDALSFDGKDDRVEIGNPHELNFEGRISLAAWVKPKSFPAAGGSNFGVMEILCHGNTDSPPRGVQLRIRHHSDPQLGVQFETGSWIGTGERISAPAADSDINRWTHLVGAYDGSAWHLYRNGKYIATQTTATGAVKVDAAWAIGFVSTYNQRHFHGDIDDVRIYNRALSAEEVAKLASTSESVSPPLGDRVEFQYASADVERILKDRCLGVYTFDEPTVVVGEEEKFAADVSGGGGHGVIQGATPVAGGKVGGAMEFDGSDDLVLLPKLRERLMADTPQFAITGWFRKDPQKPGENMVFSVGETAERGIMFAVRNNNYQLAACDPRNEWHCTVPWHSDGQWHHFAAMIDAKTMYVYLDGQARSSRPHRIARFDQQTISDLAARLGAQAKEHLQAERFYKGQLDEITFFSRKLSEAEIQTLYQTGLRGRSLLATVGGGERPPIDVPTPSPQPTPDLPSDGLVAHWQFDEGQGSRAKDTAGGHHGTIKGASWIKGVRGGALHFDGKAARVNIGNHDKLNFGGPMTMAAWIRAERIPTGITFMNVLAHNDERPSGIYLRLTNSQYAVGCYMGRHYPTEKPVPRDDVGQWVHLAGTYDGQSWHIWRNGELFYSRKTTAGPKPFDGPWAIGAHALDNERYFQGDIDDVRIYKRALSAEEVASLASAPQTAASRATAARSNGLVAHWQFDEGQGTRARDSAGGHDGNIEGAKWTSGHRGSALSFDGQDDHVLIGNPDALNFDGEITMAALIRPLEIPSENMYANIIAHMSQRDPANDLYLRLTNSQRYGVAGYTGNHQPCEKPVPREDVGNWVHLAGVYDGQSWHLYRNGAPFASRRTQYGSMKVEGDWTIGASCRGDRYYRGDIDDVRIYNRALTEEEIAKLAAASSNESAAADTPEAAPSPAAPLPGELRILRATYGLGGTQKDVTELVKKALESDPFAPLQCDDRTMGDPVVGQTKMLSVLYHYNGRPFPVQGSQGQPLIVPQPPPAGLTLRGADREFAIIAARYGAGLTWVDVTDVVREKITEPSQAIRWTGLTRQDPWFGVRKHTAVWFDYRGRRFARLIPESDTAALLP